MSSSPGEPPNRADHPPAEHLQGVIERVTYHAEDSGYTVARLKAPGERDLRTSGSAPHPRPASKLIHCCPLR
jgi:exodeoxyribonuclease V alpha subunit